MSVTLFSQKYLHNYNTTADYFEISALVKNKKPTIRSTEGKNEIGKFKNEYSVK